MPDAVVVRTSPGGDLVAAALAAAGRDVVSLRVAPVADPAPDIPVGRGLLALDPTDPLGTAVLGPLVPFRPERAVFARGEVRPLPMQIDDLLRLFPAGEQPRVATALARARAGAALASLVGGGREQRSYRDWVVQRFGEPVYERLFAPYATRRFGPPDSVVCGVARVHHGPVPPFALVAPAEGWAAAARRIADHVQGRDVHTVDHIDATGVRADGVHVGGAPWVDLPPVLLLPALTTSPALALDHDVRRLGARHGVEVLLRGGARLPFETHALDDAPFFRVVRPGLLPGTTDPGVLVVQLALDVDDPRWTGPDADLVDAVVDTLGEWALPDLDGSGARVRRLPWFHPVWGTSHLVRLRQWLLHLEGAGVTPYGRAGLASPVDPGTTLRWVAGRTGDEPVELRELARQLLEPPVLDAPERARLREMIVA